MKDEIVKAMRIFDYDPPPIKQRPFKVSVTLPKNTPFCFGVFDSDNLISKHRSFYHAQTARNSKKYLDKYGPEIKIRKL